MVKKNSYLIDNDLLFYSDSKKFENEFKNEKFVISNGINCYDVNYNFIQNNH